MSICSPSSTAGKRGNMISQYPITLYGKGKKFLFKVGILLLEGGG